MRMLRGRTVKRAVLIALLCWSCAKAWPVRSWARTGAHTVNLTSMHMVTPTKGWGTTARSLVRPIDGCLHWLDANSPAIVAVAARGAAGIQPREPEALALGPHGDLYIADRARDQILKRRRDGSFFVVAGNGRAGFSGDGGPAIKAELNGPEGMTIGRAGTIYFADSQNERIRRVSPSGIITTIAGDGKLGSVMGATPALGASLGDPADVIAGPHGDFYIADAGSDQILRLSARGILTRVAGSSSLPYAGVYGVGKPATETSPDGPYGLAFDRSGNLYIAGINTKTLLMINPQGIMTLPMGEDGFYPRGPGGMVTASDGRVLAMNNLRIVRLTPKGERTIFDFAGKHLLGPSGAFLPNGIAVGPNGTIYTDTDGVNGFSNTAALVAILPGGRTRVLWRA
ncbi:MAG: hypothetical protein ACRDGS_16735 [Chloroflexota bacterium]